MANDVKENKATKIDDDFIEEESNGKFILFIVLSILVVLGLIIGSVYYFNKDYTFGFYFIYLPQKGSVLLPFWACQRVL